MSVLSCTIHPVRCMLTELLAWPFSPESGGARFRLNGPPGTQSLLCIRDSVFSRPVLNRPRSSRRNLDQWVLGRKGRRRFVPVGGGRGLASSSPGLRLGSTLAAPDALWGIPVGAPWWVPGGCDWAGARDFPFFTPPSAGGLPATHDRPGSWDRWDWLRWGGCRRDRRMRRRWMLDAGCWMLDAGCWMLDACNLSLRAAQSRRGHPTGLYVVRTILPSSREVPQTSVQLLFKTGATAHHEFMSS
jgi:hypothetical protein